MSGTFLTLNLSEFFGLHVMRTEMEAGAEPYAYVFADRFSKFGPKSVARSLLIPCAN